MMMNCYDDDDPFCTLHYLFASPHNTHLITCTLFSDPVGVVRLNPISKDDKRIKGGKLGGGDRDGGSGPGKNKHHPSDSVDVVGDSGKNAHSNRGDTMRVPNIENAPATDSAGIY